MRGLTFTAFLTCALAFGYRLGKTLTEPEVELPVTEIVMPPDVIEAEETVADPCRVRAEDVCGRYNVSCGTVTIRVCGEITTFQCGTCASDQACVNDRKRQFCVRRM